MVVVEPAMKQRVNRRHVASVVLNANAANKQSGQAIRKAGTTKADITDTTEGVVMSEGMSVLPLHAAKVDGAAPAAPAPKRSR